MTILEQMLEGTKSVAIAVGTALAGGDYNSLSMLTIALIGFALAYNLSRITSYAIAGALAGLLGRTLLNAVDVKPLSIAFRVVAGAIMIAAAAQLMFGWRLLGPLESAGSGLWRRIAPLPARSSATHSRIEGGNTRPYE